MCGVVVAESVRGAGGAVGASGLRAGVGDRREEGRPLPASPARGRSPLIGGSHNRVRFLRNFCFFHRARSV
jgi:hypothetical protein